MQPPMAMIRVLREADFSFLLKFDQGLAHGICNQLHAMNIAFVPVRRKHNIASSSESAEGGTIGATKR